MTDAHIHLSLFEPNARQEYLLRTRELGIHRNVMAGYDEADWARQISLAKEYPGHSSPGTQGKTLHTALGIHPWVAAKLQNQDLDEALDKLQGHLDFADLIGETGLDDHRDTTDEEKSRKRRSFLRHLELSREYQKPLVLHIVKAHNEALEILRSHADGKKLSGLVHAFSGSAEIAQEYVRLGFKISIGPGILKPGFKQLKTTAQALSLEHLVLETDSPQSETDNNPDPNLLLEVASTLAKIKDVSIAEVERCTDQNIDHILGETR